MDGNGFVPYQILTVELDQPLSELRAENGYDRQPVLALIRLHTSPMGVLECWIEGGVMPASEFARQIWDQLGNAIRSHLAQDGLPVPDSLSTAGLPALESPACQKPRRDLLRQAPYVSVLVATHSRISTLGPCLDSLLATDYPNFDIIVIDNAPTDDATRKFVATNYPPGSRVRYVREERPGLASAHNCGLSQTHAPYVAITDDDVIVDRYWLTEMMKGFFQAENVGCVTGMIFPAEIDTEAQYLIERSVGYSKGYQPQIFDLHRHRPNHPLFPYAAGMFGSGANMAFDTHIIRALGGFDDGLGAGSVAMGGDDLASFFQVVAAGYTLVYEPAAIIYHRHHREYERLRKTAYGYGAGLTAYLTKTVIEQPARIFDILRKLPYGVYYALSSRSPKNTRRISGYPRELVAIERKGMLAGPILYLRSRWRTRNWQQQRLQMGTSENRIQKTEGPLQ